MNDTKQLLANACNQKREIFLTNGSFKNGIEIQMNVFSQIYNITFEGLAVCKKRSSEQKGSEELIVCLGSKIDV